MPMSSIIPSITQPLNMSDINVALIVKSIMEKQGDPSVLFPKDSSPFIPVHIERAKVLGFVLSSYDFTKCRLSKKGEDFYKFLKNVGTYPDNLAKAIEKYLARTPN